MRILSHPRFEKLGFPAASFIKPMNLEEVLDRYDALIDEKLKEFFVDNRWRQLF